MVFPTLITLADLQGQQQFQRLKYLYEYKCRLANFSLLWLAKKTAIIGEFFSIIANITDVTAERGFDKPDALALIIVYIPLSENILIST